MGTGRKWMEKGFAQLMEQAGRKANIVQGAIPRFVQLYATIPFRPREDITPVTVTVTNLSTASRAGTPRRVHSSRASAKRSITGW